MKGTIYILENKINKKKYVGQTRGKFSSRLNSHFKNNSYIGNALRKYGLDNFKMYQIVYNKNDLNLWEIYWIKELNTIYPNGYNLTYGGEGGEKSEEAKANMRKPRSPEGKAAIALSNNDPERLKNASIRFSGENNPAKRPEVREKNSKAAKERAALGIGNTDYFSTHKFCGEENKNWRGGKKKVLCANKDCGKYFEDRPNGNRKYCNRKCMGADPERAKTISDKQKGKVLSDEHLANIKIAQQKRREKEKQTKTKGE